MNSKVWILLIDWNQTMRSEPEIEGVFSNKEKLDFHLNKLKDRYSNWKCELGNNVVIEQWEVN